MSAHVDCQGCRFGRHDLHDSKWHGAPGLIGGSLCMCTGDCTSQPQPPLPGWDATATADVRRHIERGGFPSIIDALTPADLPAALVASIRAEGRAEAFRWAASYLLDRDLPNDAERLRRLAAEAETGQPT